MEKHERVLVLDFGGQYNQLIARRVRDLNVYCDLKNCDMTLEEIKTYNPIGIIFTGGPNSVYEESSPHVPAEIFSLGIPVLGICYGCQLIAYTLGGRVAHAETSEYGKREIRVLKQEALFDGIPARSVSWMSHTDYVAEVPDLKCWRIPRRAPVPLQRLLAKRRKFTACSSTPKWYTPNTAISC